MNFMLLVPLASLSADLAADLRVVLHPHWQEDPLRAEPSRRGHRLGTVDAELPRLVGGGADNAMPRDAADNHRLAAQLRPVALLDGRIEGVHANVENNYMLGGHGRTFGQPRWSTS
jgi:hypothetical protein